MDEARLVEISLQKHDYIPYNNYFCLVHIFIGMLHYSGHIELAIINASKSVV